MSLRWHQLVLALLSQWSLLLYGSLVVVVLGALSFEEAKPVENVDEEGEEEQDDILIVEGDDEAIDDEEDDN